MILRVRTRLIIQKKKERKKRPNFSNIIILCNIVGEDDGTIQVTDRKPHRNAPGLLMADELAVPPMFGKQLTCAACLAAGSAAWAPHPKVRILPNPNRTSQDSCFPAVSPGTGGKSSVASLDTVPLGSLAVMSGTVSELGLIREEPLPVS